MWANIEISPEIQTVIYINFSVTMSRFNELKKNPDFAQKGVYIISTDSLRKKNLFKVGVAGTSVRSRLYQIREILTPALGEPLIIYGLVVPKTKKLSGVAQNVRSKELNQIERAIHQIYQKKGCRDVFFDTKRYSEWVYESKIDRLAKVIADIVDNPDDTYHIHFKFVNFNPHN